MTIQTIPLDKRVLAEGNVRCIGGEANLDLLAASLAAHGLLQNLSARMSPVAFQGTGETVTPGGANFRHHQVCSSELVTDARGTLWHQSETGRPPARRAAVSFRASAK